MLKMDGLGGGARKINVVFLITSFVVLQLRLLRNSYLTREKFYAGGKYDGSA